MSIRTDIKQLQRSIIPKVKPPRYLPPVLPSGEPIPLTLSGIASETDEAVYLYPIIVRGESKP